MTDKAWKQRERQVAKFFGCKRTPLSGGNSGHTRADVIHDALFIEVKLRKKHSAVTLWDQTKQLAKKEGKTPMVALAENGRPGFWVMVHVSDLQEVASQLTESIE